MKLRHLLVIALLLPALFAACSNETTPSEEGDAAAEEQVDPGETVDEIRSLLEEVVESYEAGDADDAAEFAAEAYLENYEHLEHDIEEIDEELNEELEALLGADLRKRISEGAPVSEIEQMVAEANELLTQALDALEAA